MMTEAIPMSTDESGQPLQWHGKRSRSDRSDSTLDHSSPEKSTANEFPQHSFRKRSRKWTPRRSPLF